MNYSNHLEQVFTLKELYCLENALNAYHAYKSKEQVLKSLRLKVTQGRAMAKFDLEVYYQKHYEK